MCRPIGSWPGKKRSAVFSLTITTRWRPSPSASVKSRPDMNGIFAVAKYPGDDSRTATTGSSESFIAGWPSTTTYCVEPPPSSGMVSIHAADCTPGSARTSSTTRSKNWLRASGVAYFASGMSMVPVHVRAASNPGSTPRRLIRLRISRPAPINNISASATSETTSRLRTRPSAPEELPRPGPVLSASLASRPVSCHAGTKAATRPAAMAMAAVKPSTCVSTTISLARGRAVPKAAFNTSTPKYAAAKPTRPPPAPSTTPSASSC